MNPPPPFISSDLLFELIVNLFKILSLCIATLDTTLLMIAVTAVKPINILGTPHVTALSFEDEID